MATIEVCVFVRRFRSSHFLFFGEKRMKEKLIYVAKYPKIEGISQYEIEKEEYLDLQDENIATTDFKGIQAQTQYTPIPKRLSESEKFIKDAIDFSKLYRIDTRIIQRRGRISAHLSFDFGADMRYISHLFGMADRVSFFKDKSEHDLAVCLDFYTHVVVRNGQAIAP